MITMRAMMTKKELFDLVSGGPTAVAAIFGITPQAVSQWPDQVPTARVFELRGRRPELFADAAQQNTTERAESEALANAHDAIQEDV